MRLSRRQFLGAAGAAGVTVATGAALPGWGRATRVRAAGPLPPPGQSGIDHIVVVCMENRSFDHYLGWVPGANGRQAGLTYVDSAGHSQATHRLATWNGCGVGADPDHTYVGGRTQLDGGLCDGFLKTAPAGDTYPIGYYTDADLLFHAALVSQFSICDSWFCSFLGPTYPNRLYTHSAATDRQLNETHSTDPTNLFSTLPTIWDSLSAAGVSATYYFSDLPVLGLYGPKYAPIARPSEQFFLDATLGRLPAYSYIDPGFEDEDSGSSFDDHPHADIRRGENFLARIVNALIASPQWSSTVLIITYDEWGGFFDHVAPPRLPADGGGTIPGETPFDHGQAGFRVPTYIVSPFAPRGGILTTQYDHTSILKLVEWRWGLSPLTPRDAAANNPAADLDFTAPNLHTLPVPVVPDPGPHVCGGGMDESSPFWPQLAASPAMAAYGVR